MNKMYHFLGAPFIIDDLVEPVACERALVDAEGPPPAALTFLVALPCNEGNLKQTDIKTFIGLKSKRNQISQYRLKNSESIEPIPHCELERRNQGSRKIPLSYRALGICKRT